MLCMYLVIFRYSRTSIDLDRVQVTSRAVHGSSLPTTTSYSLSADSTPIPSPHSSQHSIRTGSGLSRGRRTSPRLSSGSSETLRVSDDASDRSNLIDGERAWTDQYMPMTWYSGCTLPDITPLWAQHDVMCAGVWGSVASSTTIWSVRVCWCITCMRAWVSREGNVSSHCISHWKTCSWLGANKGLLSHFLASLWAIVCTQSNAEGTLMCLLLFLLTPVCC